MQHQYTNAPPNATFGFGLPTAPCYPSSALAPPPLVPLSFTKLREIVSWRIDVALETQRPSTSCPHSLTATGMEPEMEVDQHWEEPDDDWVDRYTYVAASGSDKKLLDLPHPEINPLMTSEQALIEEEYVRVIAQWNGYEEEKWKAEKAYRRTPTPDTLAQFMKAASAVKMAGDAARYIELHATRHRVPSNFDALFCRNYRAPSFFLYLADPDDWNPPPWVYEDLSTIQIPENISLESLFPPQPVQNQMFPAQHTPISFPVPQWALPPVQPMQMAM